MKILVVDDELVSRRKLEKILSSQGECNSAMNGEEALSAFELSCGENEPYDLICMDLLMPGMTGEEAVIKIREHEKMIGIAGTKEVKIIIITGVNDVRSVMKLLKEGATSYIVKPINNEKILEEMKKLGLNV